IEAARAWPVGVGVIDQPGKIVTPSARDPRLLERDARLPPFWRDIEITEAVRAKQPLIAHGRQEVRLDALEIQRAGPERLASVDDQASADSAHTLADALKIDSAAIRPVTLRHSNDRRVVVDRPHQSFGPIHARLPLCDHYASAVFLCQLIPG